MQLQIDVSSVKSTIFLELLNVFKKRQYDKRLQNHRPRKNYV